MGKEVSFRGELYSSKTALAEAFGISVQRLITRINMGWSMEEALGVLKRQRSSGVGIEIRFRKTLYPSKSALAVAYGISPRLLDSRLRKGWSLEEALGVVERQSPTHQGSPVTYRGTRYPSIVAFALAFGQSPGTVFARLYKSKWSLAEAIGDENPPVSTTKGRRRRTTVATKNGKKVFATFKEAAEWCGVDRRVAHARMKIGWTLEQALQQEDPPEMAYAGFGTIYLVRNRVNGCGYVGQTMQRLKRRWKGHLQASRDGSKTRLAAALRKFGAKQFKVQSLDVASSRAELNRLEAKWIKKLGTAWPDGYNGTDGGSGNVRGVQIKYRGVVYGSMSQLAGCYGLDGETLRRRLKQGVDMKTAVESKNLHHQEFMVDGKTFKSLRAAAKHYGLKYQKVHRRLANGWTQRQALGVDSRRREKGGPIPISVGGLDFPTLSAAAKHFDLRADVVRARISNGWTQDEAFGLKEKPKSTYSANARAVVAEGVEYPSLTAAASAYQHPVSRVTARLGRGWSIEEALLKPHRDAGKH